MEPQTALPASAYIPFELGIYAVALYVLVQLARKQPAKVPVMLAAMVFAGALEVFDIRSTHTYHYNRFLLMWGDWPNWFPICIAVAWGLVLHSTMAAAQHLSTAAWARPPIVAVLAVSVDLLLDPVVASSRIIAEPGMACDATWVGPGQAIGLGFWVWCVPQIDKALIWGIPYGNFFAWGALCLAFSAVHELLHARLGQGASLARQWLLALATGLIGYHVANLLLKSYAPVVMAGVPEWAMLTAMFLPGLVLIVRAGTSRKDRPVLATTWLFVASTLFFCYVAMVVQPEVRRQLDAGFVVYAVAAGLFCAGLYYFVLVGRPPPQPRRPPSVAPLPQ